MIHYKFQKALDIANIKKIYHYNSIIFGNCAYCLQILDLSSLSCFTSKGGRLLAIRRERRRGMSDRGMSDQTFIVA